MTREEALKIRWDYDGHEGVALLYDALEQAQAEIGSYVDGEYWLQKENERLRLENKRYRQALEELSCISGNDLGDLIFKVNSKARKVLEGLE